MTAAVYGLIIASAVIAASDTSYEDAARVAVTTAVSLVVFYLAHVYAVLMGRWSQDGVYPDRSRIRAELRRQWPMVSVAVLPVAVMLFGVFGVVTDALVVDIAFFLCVGGFSTTAWYAARRSGATRAQALVAVAVAVTFGLVIVALKVWIVH